MTPALIFIGKCALICLIATPFLLIIYLLNKWAKWVNRMVNGSDKDDCKDAIKQISKLLK